MTASRVSHSISSNGWTPSLVKCRLKESFRLAPTSFSLVATITLLLDASWEGPSRWRSLWSNWGKSHRCDFPQLLHRDLHRDGPSQEASSRRVMVATKEKDVGARRKLSFKRHFTKEGVHPFDEIEWETRDAVIPNYKEGGNAFEQRDVEFPKSWSKALPPSL